MQTCVKVVSRSVSATSSTEEEALAKKEILNEMHGEFGVDIHLRLVCIMAGTIYFAVLK